MSAAAVIAAGGTGQRFGGGVPKQFLLLHGVPVIVHTLRAFERAEHVTEIIVAAPLEYHAGLESRALSKYGITKVSRVVEGGPTRQESVRLGLEVVSDKVAFVAIHDAARCLVTPELIDRTIEACEGWDGAIAALPVRDTLKAVEGEEIRSTAAREGLWAMQTPQAFRFPLIREVYRKARGAGVVATDDAAIVEWANGKVRVVPGSTENFKVTYEEDLELAGRVMKREHAAGAFRMGQGVDIHPFVEGRPLILGGVEIPSKRGLQGHSDADALVHAICDALLGALALGDIGQHFPDTDPKYRGQSSLFFLAQVIGMIRERGWEIANVDATVVTEEPMLHPHIPAIRSKLASTMGVSLEQVSVKATRPEKLGTFGRKEGLVVQAIAAISCAASSEPRPTS